MKFSLFTATCLHDAKNTQYPNPAEITSVGELIKAMASDHVCAKYKNDHRGKETFQWSNVAMLDCDNDHSDNPDLWLEPSMMADFFPDIAYVVTPSRHNWKVKDGRSERPRFHVYFLIETVKNADVYADLKKKIYEHYPFFDKNALDAARFVFGSTMTEEDVVWHEGEKTIDNMEFPDTMDEWISQWETDGGKGEEKDAFERYDDANTKPYRGEGGSGKKIPEGKRNTTMHRFAISVLMRLGDNEESRRAFEEKNNKCCVPPLEEQEMGTIWRSASGYYHNVIEKSPKYVSPEEYRKRYDYYKPELFTELCTAEVFAREYRDKLMYTPQTKYLLFDGTAWRENEKAAIRFLEELLMAQYEEASTWLAKTVDELIEYGGPDIMRLPDSAKYKRLDPEHQYLVGYFRNAEEYVKWSKSCQNKRNYSGVIHSVEHKVRRDVSELDADPYCMNTPGGVVDLRQGMASLRPNRPEDLCMKITAVAPGEKGRELWEQSLQTTFLGDSELMEYVQKVVGMAAFGKVFHEGMIICYGSGRNGKSTFWNSIGAVMGNYFRKVSADILLKDTRHNTRPEVAELMGVRLAVISETDESHSWSVSAVKQYTSTDNVVGERKYYQPVEFKPSHTLVEYTNDLPRVKELDEGTWRRLTVVPFRAHIAGESEILNYTDYLVENAGPYILQWVIEGAQKAWAEKFKMKRPRCVEEATQAYQMENNWVLKFVTDCCETGEKLAVKSSELYMAYQRWCMQNGERAHPSKTFSPDMEKSGYTKVRRKDGQYFEGLKLVEPEKDTTDFLLAG